MCNETFGSCRNFNSSHWRIFMLANWSDDASTVSCCGGKARSFLSPYSKYYLYSFGIFFFCCAFPPRSYWPFRIINLLPKRWLVCSYFHRLRKPIQIGAFQDGCDKLYIFTFLKQEVQFQVATLSVQPVPFQTIRCSPFSQFAQDASAEREQCWSRAECWQRSREKDTLTLQWRHLVIQNLCKMSRYKTGNVPLMVRFVVGFVTNLNR